MRPPYRLLAEWLAALSPADFKRKQREADVIFRRLGITFSVAAPWTRSSA